MQFINIIPFPILNLMKLGYFAKVELNKEVETCRQNAQKKHWNMIVGTYDEKQKIVLQCFNASENADFRNECRDFFFTTKESIFNF